jgi:hypothetical protein
MAEQRFWIRSFEAESWHLEMHAGQGPACATEVELATVQRTTERPASDRICGECRQIEPFAAGMSHSIGSGPDFKRSFELLGDPDQPAPAWGLGGSVPTVASSSSAALDLTTKLGDELRDLASRVDGDVRKEITRAADDAQRAASEARGAQQAARLLHDQLKKIEAELSNAGILQMKTDVSELRRQLHEHVDRHEDRSAPSAGSKTKRR